MPLILEDCSRSFQWAVRNVRRRGVLTTAKVAWSCVVDAAFDLRHGTETRRVVEPEEFELELENRGHAVAYQPSKSRPFEKLLASLPLPRGCTFVDVGSGKGRILLLAAQNTEHRFRRVVGLEFSSKFCALARQNIEVFRRSRPNLAPIEIVQGDATQYSPSGDENVFFLFNPFDGLILMQFLKVLERSLVHHPRQIWLVYSVPQHADVVAASGLFSQRESLNLAGNDVYVYSNAVAEVSVSSATRN